MLQTLNNPGMLRSRFEDLRREKEYREKRRLPLRTIAAETGLSLTTVQRISAGNVEKTYLSTIETLCLFFGAKSIAELVEIDAEPKQ